MLKINETSKVPAFSEGQKLLLHALLPAQLPVSPGAPLPGLLAAVFLYLASPTPMEQLGKNYNKAFPVDVSAPKPIFSNVPSCFILLKKCFSKGKPGRQPEKVGRSPF